MNFFVSRWWRGLWQTSRTAPAQKAERIVAMQLHIVLPAKTGLIAVVLYFQLSSGADFQAQNTYNLVLEILHWFLSLYIIANAAAGVIFCCWRRFPPAIFQWLVFTLGILDGVFIAGLVFLTDGFTSMVYWLFPGLIVLNAISIPLAIPQIVLNILFSLFYVTAGVLNVEIPPPVLYTPPANMTFRQPAGNHFKPVRSPELPFNMDTGELNVEPDLPRLFVLWLLAACCYGVQALLERQRLAVEEAKEFAAREGQLHSAGRLAAEFAHQIKNPLAIINNTAHSLQRSVRENKASAAQQIEIIQEEVARADKVITQIMGYAQLSEGRVEKLDVVEEIERAIAQVFPAAMPTRIIVHRAYAPPFPPLLMLHGHLSEIFVNLLQNARDALSNQGNIFVAARCQRDLTVEISIADDGPGIPPEKIVRIFEAYYTTKQKGSGLGLAIVKHNTEIYGGVVRLESPLLESKPGESGLGNGAKFTVSFPAKSLPRPLKK